MIFTGEEKVNTFENLLKIYDYIRPVLDVSILTFILYWLYKIIIKTNGLQIFTAALLLGIGFAIAYILDLTTILWILKLIGPGLFMVFAVVFQPEIRKIVLKLGQTEWFALGARSKHSYVDSTLIAADLLSKQKRGMLAVFQRHTKLDDVIETGNRLNADLSSNLLLTIFGHDTPFHDGAVIIQGGKVLAAGCFLPLSEQRDIRKTFGTRHRAALGLSESTDAVVLVVSEETGALSLAYESQLHYDLTIEQCTKMLESLLHITPDAQNIEDTIDEHTAINK